jgi:tetratricopeptide (TPR) repeat protein
MIRFRILTFLSFSLMVIGLHAATVKIPLTELQNLNEAIDQSHLYDGIKRSRIDSLKNQLSTIPNDSVISRWQQLMKIGREYLTFSADSALYYFKTSGKEAAKTKNRNAELKSRIATMSALSAAGLYSEATREIDRLSGIDMPISIKVDFWKNARQHYSSLFWYLGNKSEYGQAYLAKAISYTDSILTHIQPTDPFYKLLRAEKSISQGRYIEARATLDSIIKTTPKSASTYGMALYKIADIYKRQGNETDYASYLAKTAIADVRNSVKEGWALPSLAVWLYEQNDLDGAYEYINYSLQEALSGNARMRSAAIANLLPTIIEDYRKELSSSHEDLTIYLSLVTVLLIISSILLFGLLHQMKESKKAQKQLSRTSSLQESYLGHFVGLCANYSAKLESWQQTVLRKISSGQTDDLMKAIKSGKFNDETEDFHSIFDKAFLELYPDFIEKINLLLKEDEQFDTNIKDTLPTELRIYALIRLGVDESVKIASILQYSPNTVYAYRNKMRNKALNRDTFENDVVNIGHLDV